MHLEYAADTAVTMKETVTRVSLSFNMKIMTEWQYLAFWAILLSRETPPLPCRTFYFTYFPLSSILLRLVSRALCLAVSTQQRAFSGCGGMILDDRSERSGEATGKCCVAHMKRKTAPIGVFPKLAYFTTLRFVKPKIRPRYGQCNVAVWPLMCYTRYSKTVRGVWSVWNALSGDEVEKYPPKIGVNFAVRLKVRPCYVSWLGLQSY